MGDNREGLLIPSGKENRDAEAGMGLPEQDPAHSVVGLNQCGLYVSCLWWNEAKSHCQFVPPQLRCENNFKKQRSTSSNILLSFLSSISSQVDTMGYHWIWLSMWGGVGGLISIYIYYKMIAKIKILFSSSDKIPLFPYIGNHKLLQIILTYYK